MSTDGINTDIAIVGMACRFPGADSADKFWDNIVNKVNSITQFSDEELIASGFSEELIKNINYVKAKGYLKDADQFDADFFRFSKHEAEILDPQYRLFFETTWQALENAAYVPDDFPGKISLFAGSSNINSYYAHNLANSKDTLLTENFTAALHNAKDFLSTLIAYKLNLRGAAVTIQSACSTSLVSVCMACQNLLAFESDIAIAGGTCVSMPLKSGYLFQDGMMLSPTGQCSTFDQKANGTVLGNGLGVVVLKRLPDALRDSDNIQAVIKGFAVNNDGENKVGFTAPGISGQQAVIEDAIAKAGIRPGMISYIETHGTGTILGDLIELEGLSQVFKKETVLNPINLGSVKPNIGHLDAAAGIASLIKAVQALKHQILPPNINFNAPSSQLNFESTPFRVNTSATPWTSKSPRYCGVSSFGIGGTNSHIVLTQAPKLKKTKPSTLPVFLILSARSSEALEHARKNLANFLQKNQSVDMTEAAYTLQVGRKHFKFRKAYLVNTAKEAISKLEQDVCMHPEDSIENFDSEVIKWLQGTNVNWQATYKGKKHRRLPLPNYPFERNKYWATDDKPHPNTFKNEKTAEGSNKKKAAYYTGHIEKKITEIFERFLVQKNIDIDLTFDQLGGDSLIALLISHEINRNFQFKLLASNFDKDLSIRSLGLRVANYLENQ